MRFFFLGKKSNGFCTTCKKNTGVAPLIKSEQRVKNPESFLDKVINSID